MKNIFVRESKRKVARKKPNLEEFFGPLPETEEDWTNKLVRDMEE